MHIRGPTVSFTRSEKEYMTAETFGRAVDLP